VILFEEFIQKINESKSFICVPEILGSGPHVFLFAINIGDEEDQLIDKDYKLYVIKTDTKVHAVQQAVKIAEEIDKEIFGNEYDELVQQIDLKPEDRVFQIDIVYKTACDPSIKSYDAFHYLIVMASRDLNNLEEMKA